MGAQEAPERREGKAPARRLRHQAQCGERAQQPVERRSQLFAQPLKARIRHQPPRQQQEPRQEQHGGHHQVFGAGDGDAVKVDDRAAQPFRSLRFDISVGLVNARAEFVWVLDPIDGTKSFITGRPQFGTIIGLLHEGKPAVDRYLKFLSSGSSDYSIELLKKAGVDMTSPEPIRQALQLFDSHLTQMEELIG